MLDWLTEYALWTGLFLLLLSALTRKSLAAALGWAIFGIFWLGQLGRYLEVEDYFNVALVLAAALLSFYLAWLVFRKGFSRVGYAWASYAAAVCGIVYFPFAEIEPLKAGLIGFTTAVTVQTLQYLSVPVVMQSWNLMSLNGKSVELILACTAIESIALFAGVILSVQAPLGRRALALAASVPTIYILNRARSGFVLMAYAYSWFGADSFDLAHNVIGKAGSVAALLAISYVVFLLLPELLATMDELAAEIRHPGGEAA